MSDTDSPQSASPPDGFPEQMTVRQNTASRPIHNRAAANLFICSFIVSFIALSAFSCMCGHISVGALPVSTFGAALAWFPFVRYQRRRVMDRCLAVFFVLIATLVLIKNIADVLWFGHEPLFP